MSTLSRRSPHQPLQSSQGRSCTSVSAVSTPFCSGFHDVAEELGAHISCFVWSCCLTHWHPDSRRADVMFGMPPIHIQHVGHCHADGKELFIHSTDIHRMHVRTLSGCPRCGRHNCLPCKGKAWDCAGSGSLFGGCAGSGEHRLRQARLDHAAVNVDPQAMHLVICLELWSPPLPCAAVCPGLCLFLFAKSS